MKAGIINNNLSNLAMINLRIKAGMLVSQAISEVKSSRQKLSVDMLLIGAGVVGSDSSLS